MPSVQWISVAVAVVSFAGLLDAVAAQTDEAPTTITVLVSEERGAGPVTAQGRVDLLPDAIRDAVALRRADGSLIQIDRRDGTATLRWIETQPLAAGSHAIAVTPGPAAAAFEFVDGDDRRTLQQGDRPIYRYEYAFDPERLEATFKPFHHLLSPGDGAPITKGAGGHYSHHRGVFVGWNRTSSGERSGDFWHGANGASQRHAAQPLQHAGPVCADSVEVVNWCDADGDPMVREQRAVTAWRSDTMTILDFTVSLSATGDTAVHLRGDPQHAGFQIRAADEVHDHQELTVYQRPDAAVGGANDVWSELDWCRLITPIRDRRYAILLVNHPQNGADWVFSTRAYGRFGIFKALELQPRESTVLQFRILIEDLGPADADHPRAPQIDAELATRTFHAAPLGLIP